MHCTFLDQAAGSPKKALPILSFPAAKKLGLNVNELVHSSELQAKAMEYVAHNTPIAASVSLMDLSVEAEAFGAQVRFSEWEVPSIIGQLISDGDEAKALTIPPIGAGRTGVCIEAISKAKKLIPDKPVLAGVIGPYSLAGRLMDVTEIMYACYDEPETVHTVLEKCSCFICTYCLALKEAGADGVIMAEPLAGLLSAEMAKEFSNAYVQSIIEKLHALDFPLIYHNCGNTVTSMLPELFAMGAAAYHFGNAVDMSVVMKNTPADVQCLGNISPVDSFAKGSPADMRLSVRALMDECGSYANFIPSSGCDIPAHADWNNIMSFFDTVKEYR